MHTRYFAPRGLVLAALLFSLSPRALRAQATGGWQARTWDVEVSVPPGGWRATKPIELEGKFDVHTQPGAMIEGVSFQGKKDDQHWKIEGSQLRKVRIGGQLGVSLHATDSVFEDCEMNKDSGWFVSWWSTRWKFENCIFTKSFVRRDLPPGDYQVEAKRCTFYNVKLPSIGMKENPAGYLQHDDIFEGCHFIQCEVPETVLAASVDCVFEGCQFSGKRQAWPKETGSIRVRAFFATGGSAPASFINGPLTVQFAPVAKDAVFGANLPHTLSGGRVTLKSLPVPAQFGALGAVQKKASEIPNVAAPSGAAAPSVPAAAGELHSFEELLRPMPAGISVMTAGQLNIPGVEAANEWLKTCTGRPVAMRVILEVVQATKDDGYANQVLSREQGLLIRGGTVPAQVVALFRADAAAPLARAQKGTDLPLRGVVKKAEFVGRGRTVALVLTLGEAHTP